MRTRHLIDTAVFDIGFSDEETAFQTQSELEVFIKRQMMGVIDEVFDAASQAGFVMRIPSLEVDLGSVAYCDYQDELPRRLRERLTALLAEFRVSATGRAASNSHVIDRRQAEYHQLEYFLINGHLPWYSSLDDEVDLEGLLGLALSENAARLKNLLQTTPHRHLVVTRLVSQFTTPSIVQLFHLLAPSHAPIVNELMEKLTLAWRGNSTIVNALGLSHKDTVAQLWLFLIEIILGQDGHQYSAQELLAQALRVMLFEKYGINRKVVAAYVAQTDRLDSAYLFSVNAVMHQLIQGQASEEQRPDGKITGEHDSLQTHDDNERDHTGLNNMEALRAMLRAAIVSGDASAIITIWDRLLSNHGSMLEQLLRQYGQQAQIRKKLAYGFSEALLHDILKLIEPMEQGFITSVIEQHEPVWPTQGGQTQGRERRVRRMWEYSLGYLLVERGSRFNKKSYLTSLLRQMAASQNMNFQMLLDDLLENLGIYGANSRVGRQMRQLLLELKEEQGTSAAETKTANSQELRAYVLYGLLNQALLEGHAVVEGGEADLVKVIDELQQDHPWQLMRILRELQSGAISWSLAHTGLSTVLLRQLMLAFLEVTNLSSSGSRPELHDAVIANAERSMNQNQYYRRLLSCLIKRELIDFEAILVSTGGDTNDSVERQADDEGEPLSKQPALPEITDDKVEARLNQFLHGEIELSSAEARSLINGITRQFEQQPLRFLQLSVLQNANEQQIARLVALLPDRLLAGMVARLAGQSFQRMLQYAELISTACLGSQVSVTPALLRQLKWEYIFAYLAGTGRLFNERGFIQRYVESLIEQTRADDPQQFRALLCQQLVVNILPSTRDASHRIVDLLSNPVDEKTAQQADTAALRDEAVPSEAQELGAHEEVTISNAGIVLASPYLPRLFEMLGLTEKSAFKDREAGLRAVQLLQYLVNEKSDSPEYQLFLNKLLCGLNSAEPMRCEIVLTEHEKELLDGLLQGMIDNWKVLGNTTLAGLREAFLQRQGRLQLRDGAWRLQVESKAFDMLLDQLPWGFSTIKYPWMERVIYVEWR